MPSQHIEKMTHGVAKWSGTTSGFITGIASILIWIFIGKLNKFSTDWERDLSIYINVITFLMIFVVQRSLNKEISAIHIKLNELIVASARADNTMVTAENLSEQEISEVQESHRRLATDGDESLL